MTSLRDNVFIYEDQRCIYNKDEKIEVDPLVYCKLNSEASLSNSGRAEVCMPINITGKQRIDIDDDPFKAVEYRTGIVIKSIPKNTSLLIYPNNLLSKQGYLDLTSHYISNNFPQEIIVTLMKFDNTVEDIDIKTSYHYLVLQKSNSYLLELTNDIKTKTKTKKKKDKKIYDKNISSDEESKDVIIDKLNDTSYADFGYK